MTTTTSAPGRMAPSRPTFASCPARRMSVELPFLYCCIDKTLSSRAFHAFRPLHFLSPFLSLSKCFRSIDVSLYLCSFLLLFPSLVHHHSLFVHRTDIHLSEFSLSPSPLSPLSSSLPPFSLPLPHPFLCSLPPSSLLFIFLFFLHLSVLVLETNTIYTIGHYRVRYTRHHIVMPALDLYATVKVVRFPWFRLSFPI